MAQNPADAYGSDIGGIADADDLFTEISGVDLVAQDAIFAITQEDFLGPGGNGRGYDIRKLIGAADDELEAQGPIIAAVLIQDDRIDTADVVLAATKTNGLDDVSIQVICTTGLGPFTFTKSVLELSTTIGDPES